MRQTRHLPVLTISMKEYEWQISSWIIVAVYYLEKGR